MSMTSDNVVSFMHERFGEASLYADKSWDLVAEFLNKMKQDFVDNPLVQADTTFPEVAPSLNLDLVGLKPEAPNLEYTETELPTLELDDIEQEDYPDIPEFTEAAPSINLPTAPDDTLPTEPGAAPTLSSIDVPNAPVLSLPTAPSFSTITFPSDVELDTITFTGEMPTLSVEAPSGMFIYDEEVYTSLLKDPLDAKILNDIVNGGTGLDSSVEEAIYTRGRNRLEEERLVQHDMTLNYFAAKGFTLPPGAVQARLTEIDRKFNNSLNDINRDIIIKQAELTWQNLKETITAGLNRENSLMQYANNVAQRAFDTSKYTIESAIAVYNAKVSEYGIKLEGYKTQAAVYSERVRAQLTEVEVYKAKMEGKRIESAVQQNLVNIYLAKIGAVEAEIKIYNTQMQGAALQAQLDKLKLESYELAVNTFKTKVEAKTAAFNMYQAQIMGETSKISVYSEKVKAYTTLVDSKKTMIDAKVAELNGRIETNNSKVAAYTAELEAFKANITQNVSRVDAGVKVYGADASMYSVDIQAQMTDMNAQIEQYKAETQKAAAETELVLKQATINMESVLKQHNLQLEAAKAGANVAAQIVASSLTSVNASTNLGWSGSYNSAYSYDRTKGDDSGASTINQHIWNEG